MNYSRFKVGDVVRFSHWPSEDHFQIIAIHDGGRCADLLRVNKCAYKGARYYRDTDWERAILVKGTTVEDIYNSYEQ
jgi:hypothetical protein